MDSLSDIGSIASILSLLGSLIAGIFIGRWTVKNEQVNKLFSFFNSGTITQENNIENK